MKGHKDEEANAPLLETQPTPAQNDAKESLWNRYVWRNGFFLVSLSAFTFSSQLVFLKKVEDKLPEMEILWARGVFVCLTILLAKAIFKSNVSPLGKRENMSLLAMQGLFGVVQLVAGWGSIMYVPIAECLAIIFSNSIITASLAAILGLDKWSRITPVAVVLSVVGVLLVTRPSAIFSKYALVWDSDRILGLSLAAGSTICFSGIYLISRKLNNREGGVTQLFWQALVLTIVSPISLAMGVPSKPVFRFTFHELAFLLIVVLLGALAWFLLYRSVQLTSATVGSVMGSTQLMWSFLFDMLFFGQSFSVFSVAGSLCVVGAAAVIALTVIRK
ncbi:hypothetical protein BSKO_02282 [Bryopsis sp. KO-2023]|nr:hypothetical protein BSKO_02282 [Bryopsis sp. KO-2023]